jgi:hypothetical protein
VSTSDEDKVPGVKLHEVCHFLFRKDRICHWLSLGFPPTRESIVNSQLQIGTSYEFK